MKEEEEEEGCKRWRRRRTVRSLPSIIFYRASTYRQPRTHHRVHAHARAIRIINHYYLGVIFLRYNFVCLPPRVGARGLCTPRTHERTRLRFEEWRRAPLSSSSSSSTSSSSSSPRCVLHLRLPLRPLLSSSSPFLLLPPSLLHGSWTLDIDFYVYTRLQLR